MRLVFSLILGLLAFGGYAQDIPNGDFEEWSDTLSTDAAPTFWTSNWGNIYINANGDRKVKIPYNISGQGLNVISTTVNISEIPQNISFNCQLYSGTPCIGFSPQYGCELSLVCEFLFLSEIVAQQTHFFYAGYSEEMEVMEFEDVGLQIDSVQIAINIIYDNTPPGVATIDDFMFNVPTGIGSYETDRIRLIPVPASDKLKVELDIPHDYKIFDNLGRRVLEGRTSGTIEVSELQEGSYTLLLLTEDGMRNTQSFLIQR